MWFLISAVLMGFAIANQNDTYFMVSGLFAIASAISGAGLKIEKLAEKKKEEVKG